MQEGVVKKSHREAGVEVFDGLVRGVLASAELKFLVTKSIPSVGRALKENTLRDLKHREYSHLIQICSPELL